MRVQGVPGCLAHRDVRRQRGTAIRTVCVGGAGDRHARICQLQALSAGQGDAIQPFLRSASVLIAATSKCFLTKKKVRICGILWNSPSMGGGRRGKWRVNLNFHQQHLKRQSASPRPYSWTFNTANESPDSELEEDANRFSIADQMSAQNFERRALDTRLACSVCSSEAPNSGPVSTFSAR